MAALAAWIGPAVVGTVQAGAGVTSDAELVYAQWYNNGFFGTAHCLCCVVLCCVVLCCVVLCCVVCWYWLRCADAI